MRAIEIQGAFGLENLKLVERPDPRPGPGQALVRLRAASLNFRDLLTAEGKYNPKQKLPLIPCSDGAGEVVGVGEGVTRVKPGDRVVHRLRPEVARRPTHPRAAALDAGWAARRHPGRAGRLRSGRAGEDAGCAHRRGGGHPPLRRGHRLERPGTEGHLTAGDTVLVQGTGGVSLFALQLAKLLGARVIATSSSDEKLARVRGMGADETINYTATPAWGARARELTEGLGVDHVVEVGGAGTLQQSLQATRFGGTISLIGNLAGTKTELLLTHVFMQQIRLQGILVGNRESFEAMNRAIAQNGLKPVIDRAFPLEEAPAAFRAMAAGGHFGKIVIGI